MADFKFPNRCNIEEEHNGGQDADVKMPERHHYADPILLDPVKFTDKLFKSERHTFTCLKAIFGILCGVISGGLFFLLLKFSFGYENDLAGYISAGWTILSSIALALSVHARCITVLMIPSLFTGRGRAAILAIIFGLLLSRPIKNISENASEVSRCMACSTELFHNQSISLQQQLKDPIDTIKKALGEQADDIKEIGKLIMDAVEPIYNAIKAVQNGLDIGSKALNVASKKCTRDIGNVHTKCVEGISRARNSCINKLRQGNQYVLHAFRFEVLCDILKIDAICNIVKADFLCSPLRGIETAARILAEKAVYLTDQIEKWFQFNVISKSGRDKVTYASKTTETLIAEVKSALESRKITMTRVVEMINKLLALSLILLLTQSFFYLKNYLAKDDFDNIYITSQFKNFDNGNVSDDTGQLLPLRKKEKELYVDTTMPMMSTKEKKQILIGFTQIILHMILSALLIFFNYVLYYVMYLVNRYGRVKVEISGESKINFNVKGGKMAEMINTFINNINIENNYQANYNTTICLPNPKEPDSSDIPILVGTYVAAIILVFMQAYGSRLNRKICAYYYHEQEEVRIKFLRNKILYNRRKRKTFMRQHVKSMIHQKQTEQKLSFKQILTAKCPCFKPSMKHPENKFCMNCGVTSNSKAKVEACKNTDCSSMYCIDCLHEFKKICPECQYKN